MYQDESWALKFKSDRRDAGGLGAAGLLVGGAQETLRAARCLLHIQ